MTEGESVNVLSKAEINVAPEIHLTATWGHEKIRSSFVCATHNKEPSPRAQELGQVIRFSICS